jgi:hypothetical protein
MQHKVGIRDYRLNLRLGDKELGLIESAARKAGMQTGTYARVALLRSARATLALDAQS